MGAGDISDCGRPRTRRRPRSSTTSPGTVVTLGDNAYTSGTRRAVPGLLRPDLGPAQVAHEAVGRQPRVRHRGRRRATSATSGPPPATGKGYYSYDLGAWHMIVLNCNCGDGGCGASSAAGAVAAGRPGRQRGRCTHRLLASPALQLGRARQRRLGPAVLARPVRGRRRHRPQRPRPRLRALRAAGPARQRRPGPRDPRVRRRDGRARACAPAIRPRPNSQVCNETPSACSS